MITGEQIRAARAMLDWTRFDLAHESGVGHATVQNFERGWYNPTQINVDKIVQAFLRQGVEFIDRGVRRIKQSS